MARLPVPGGDDNTWGDILNEYLSVSHDADGLLKDDTVGIDQLQDDSVTAAALATGAVTKADVGLSNVDNTADTAKPVSTATQTALDLKAATASPSFSGTTLTLADAQNVVVGTTTGTKIGTATTQKIGFFNATPVAQQGVGIDLATALANLGLRAAGASNADRWGNVLISSATTLTTASPALGYVQSTSASYNITLPGTTLAGFRFTFIKFDATAFPVTVLGTFNSGTNYVLANQWDHVTVISTSISGTWFIASSNHAAQITNGVVGTARLGSGTANSGAYLRGDSTWNTLDKTAVGLANVDNTSDTNKPVSTAQQTALDTKVTHGATTPLAPQTGVFQKLTIVDDSSSSAGWPDRFAFSYDDASYPNHYTSWFNEFGEFRAISAKPNTIPFRLFTKDVDSSTDHDVDVAIFQIVYNRDTRTEYHEMFSNGNFMHSGDGTVGGTLAVTGDVTAPNIGEKVVTWATGSEPSLAGVPDGTLWVEYTP